jgi:hypothetical protein
VETVNDADGLVCNAWRAIRAEPDKVAEYADLPIIENDMHARHVWLIERKESLQARLEGDPDYYDAKIAGWWLWGMACWIGSGFCSSNGPWQVVEKDGVRELVQGDAGQGVNRKRVHLNRAQGVNRKRVHLIGRGVNRNLVHLTSVQGVSRKHGGLLEWMEALSARLERVRVCCGDWRRVCGGRSGNALAHFFAGGEPCAIFLDPPYADSADRADNLYRVDSQSVAHDVREWAIAHGDDPRLRIALCGYEGEHAMPESWECLEWKAAGGMAHSGQDDDSPGKVNCHRERVWFNKSCIRESEMPLFA